MEKIAGTSVVKLEQPPLTIDSSKYNRFSSFPPDPEMTRAPFKPPSGGMESAK